MHSISSWVVDPTMPEGGFAMIFADMTSVNFSATQWATEHPPEEGLYCSLRLPRKVGW